MTQDQMNAAQVDLSGYLRLPVSPATPLHANPDKCIVVMLANAQPASSQWHIAPQVVGRMVLRGYRLQVSGLPGRVPGQPQLIPGRSAVERHRAGSTAPASDLRGIHLRPVGHLGQPQPGAEPSGDEALPATTAGLRLVRDGTAYRLRAEAKRNLVTPGLAQALETAFEKFALRMGYGSQNPVEIELRRGYEAGDFGHGRGMASDIQGVGGRGMAEWKRDSDEAIAQLRVIPSKEQRRAFLQDHLNANLGYQLYRTLLEQGGWRVFNNVVQLFGPWTDRVGPWRRVQFAVPDGAQRRFAREQEHIYRAHQDHIHVAFG